MNKSVSFSSNFFKEVLDNLFISDQIFSFDEKLIKKHNIHCLINLTKNAPFLFNLINIKININFLSQTNTTKKQICIKELSQSNPHINDMCSKLNSIVKTIHKLLLINKKVLIYCENGYSKTIPILLCYFIKYPHLYYSNNDNSSITSSSNTNSSNTNNLNEISSIQDAITRMNSIINLETYGNFDNLYICKFYRDYLVDKQIYSKLKRKNSEQSRKNKENLNTNTIINYFKNKISKNNII